MTSTNETDSLASHHHSTTPPQSSMLMGLARELRDHIYFYMVEPRRSLEDLTGHPSDWFNPAILLTNRQIRSEALSVISEMTITVLVRPLVESNHPTTSKKMLEGLRFKTKVLEGLRFKRCGIEIDLRGPDGKEIAPAHPEMDTGFLKRDIMRSDVLDRLVEQLNRMPFLEVLHIWNPRPKIFTDRGPRQPKENADVDRNDEMDVDDEAGTHEYPAANEALSLTHLRQLDDAVFIETTTGCFRQIAHTVNVTIEGNLSVQDSKRILNELDGFFMWRRRAWKDGFSKTPWRFFGVDTTRALCQSGGTKLVSKVISVSTVSVPGFKGSCREIWDNESAAAIRTFIDGGS